MILKISRDYMFLRRSKSRLTIVFSALIRRKHMHSLISLKPESPTRMNIRCFRTAMSVKSTEEIVGLIVKVNAVKCLNCPPLIISRF